MKKVTITIMCDDDDAEGIAHQMINSNPAQYGLFCWGTRIEDCTEEEKKEVESQLPEEILKERKN